MLEQGLQVFNGVFKRVYRSMRSEFRKLYKLNSIYLDNESYFAYHDSDTRVLRTDYQADPKDLIPAADPNAFSNKEKAQKAQMISERANMVAGYDPVVVEKRWLSAMEVPDIEELYPMVEDEEGNRTLKFPPQPNPEFEIQREELAMKALEGQSKNELGKGELEIKFMLAEAQVMKMIADAEVAADKPNLERLKLQLQDMISKREALTDLAVAEIGHEERASNGVD